MVPDAYNRVTEEGAAMAISANRRKLRSIALGVCLLVLFAALTALNAFNTAAF